MEQPYRDTEIQTKSELNDKLEDYTALLQVINEGNIPFYHKICLTIEEAARYAGIGISRMRQICEEHEELYILNGCKKMVKREALEKFIQDSFTI